MKRNSRSRSLFALYSAAMLAASPFAHPASAATYVWNTNGSATWETTADWTPNPASFPFVGDNADFSQVNLTVNPTITITALSETVGNLLFGNLNPSPGQAWTIAGSATNTLTVVGATVISMGLGAQTTSTAVGTTNQRVTISAPIVGTGSVTFQGTGTNGVFRLNNTTTTTNSYSGGTIINNAEVYITNATVGVANTQFGTGTVTLNSGMIHFAPGNNNGPFYYNNNFVLNGGTVFGEDGNEVLGTDGLGNFDTIAINGPVELRREWGDGQGNGTGVSNHNMFLAGILTGTGPLTITAVSNPFSQSGRVVISNPSNSYSGTITINAAGNAFGNSTNGISIGAAVVEDSNTALQFATINLNGNGRADGSGAASGLQFSPNAPNPIIGALQGNGNLILVNTGAGSPIPLTVGGTNANTTHSGVISGGGSLIKVGNGTLTLQGSSTFTGGTTISSGSIAISGPSNLGATASPLSIGAGKLEIASGSASFASPRLVTLSDPASTVQVDDAATTFTDSSTGITGGGNLTKTGLGTYILSAQGTYAGTTTISAGKLTASAGLAGGKVSIAANATLGVSNGSFTGGIASNGGAINSVDGAIHTVTSPGGLTFNAGSTLNVEIGPGAAADKIDATGGTLTLNGATTLNLTAFSGFSTGTYDLIDFSGFTGTGNILFSNAGTVAHGSDNITGVPNSPAAFTYTLSRNSSSELLTITVNLASALYFTGAHDNTWNRTSGGTNWSTTATSPSDAGQTPSSGIPDVVFIPSADPTGANLATVLGTDTSIKGLSFAGAMTGAVSIGGANTLTMGVDGITVDAGSNADTLNTTGSAGNPGVALLVNQTWTNNSANPFTVNSSVGGTPMLTIAGTGVVVLNGSNSYSGGTTLFGTVKVGNASALGTGTVLLDPSTLDLNNTNLAVSLITGTGTITNTASGAASLTVNGAASGTFAGVIQNGSGTVGLVMAGAGKLTLVGVQTYTGGTTVNAGTLQVGDATTLSSLAGNITTNATVAFAVPVSQSQTISNVIAGTGGVTANGGGAMTLSASNSYSGATTVAAAGTLVMGNAHAFGSGGPLVVNGNSTLDVNGFSPTVSSLGTTDGNNGNTITNSGVGVLSTLTINGTANTIYGGAFNDGNGTLALVKAGTGSLTLQFGSSPTFSGGVQVTGGTLALGQDGGNGENAAVFGSGNVTISNGANLRLGGQGGALANYTISSPITFNNGNVLANDGGQYFTGNLTIAAGGAQIASNWSGKDVYVEGPLLGSGPLAISGGFNGGNGGAVHIGTSFGFFGTASNTYNGTVTVNPGGTLSIGSQYALANAPLVVNGTLAFDAAGGQPIFIGGLTGTGTVNLADVASTPVTLTIGQGNASTTFNGILAGATGGGLTKVGNGTFTLTQKSTYTGPTIVSGGTLRLTPVAAALPTPLGHYTLDGTFANSAGTAGGMSNGVLDTTSYYAGATVQGGFVPGIIGQAFNFNANASIDITLSSSATLALKNNAWTVSFWENYTDPNSGGFLSKSNGTAINNGDTVFQGGNGGFYAGNYAGVVENGGSWNVANTSGQALNDGNWHLVTYSSTGGNVSIYVDGSLATPFAQTFTIPATLTDSGTVIRLGWNGTAPDGHQPNNGANRYYGAFNVLDGGLPADEHTPGYYSGMLDDVYFFNSALTATQVQSLYSGNSAALPVSLLPASSFVTVSANSTLAMTATASGTPKQLLNVAELSIDGAVTGGVIAPTGTIDLGNGHAIIQSYQYTTDEVRQLLKAGYSGGTWAGTGITSTTAAVPANAGQGIGYVSYAEYNAYSGGTSTSFDGVTLFGTETLVKYTYQGDANLDGQITMADYAQIDSSFLLGQTTGQDWFHGDFNYDGVVNYLDYALIDFAFMHQTGGPLASSMIAEHAAEFGAPYLAALAADGAAVPEPASLALLGLGALALLRRKR